MGFSTASQIPLFCNVFFVCISAAIIIPSLWPYLNSLNASKSYLALVVAFCSVGEAIGAIYFGAKASKLTTRSAMLQTIYMGTFGSFLYCIAELFPNTLGQTLVLLGRFAQGMWSGGSQALQTCFVAAVLPKDQLTPVIVRINVFASLGFVIGPAFGVLFSVMPDYPMLGSLRFNELTGPGYLTLITSSFIIVLFICVFDEEGDRASYIAETTGLLEENKVRDEEMQIGEEGEGFAFTTGVVVCNIVFFVHFYGFALQDTITMPLVQEYYDWSIAQGNILFTAGGIVGLGSFAGVHFASRHYSDRAMTLFSLLVGMLGYMLLISTDEKPLSQSRFLYGFALISVAFRVGRTTTVGMYTKLLPLKDQGTGQGYLLAVGAVAGILGPFWAVRAFLVKDGGLVVFGGSALLFMACSAVITAFYGRLMV